MTKFLPLLIWAACAPAPSTTPTSSAVSAVDHLVRASMALRGHRPTVVEQEAVESDPATLPALVRGWLTDPALGDTIRDLHGEQWLLRTDVQPKPPPLGVIDGYELGHVTASLDDAPLHLVQDIVMSGRPYTEVVTTDVAWADPVVAGAYGLEHDRTGPEWQASRWTDGRPAAGVLSSTSLWQRHMSSDTNHHRARSNFVAGKLLCEDYLDRDVVVGAADLDDPYAAEEKVRSDPGCRACHDTLDPMASAFFGVRKYILRADVIDAWLDGCPEPQQHACYPLAMWDPDALPTAEDLGMPEPAFYGEPVADLSELGEAIAADPRFARCTSRRFFGWLAQVPLAEVPESTVTELTTTLVDNDWDARELLIAAVLHPSFAATDGPVGVQSIRPEQLARTIEDLTGHRLRADPNLPGCETSLNGCYGPVDMTTTDLNGFRTLLGGVDGWDVTSPTHTPTPSAVLIWSWLAEESAGVVVDQDLSTTGERRLLTQVDADTVADGLVREQLAALHWRIVAERVDPGTLALSHGLWTAAHNRTGDPAHAWKVVIAALLQDPRLVMF